MTSLGDGVITEKTEMSYAPIDKELFHIHTWRCGHADDDPDEELVKKAVELGAERIVFTDHAPFPGDPFGARMKMAQLPEYIQTLQGLKEQYRDRIEVLVGLEIEYFPSFRGYYEELRENPGLDLLVLGQHMAEYAPGVYSFSSPDRSGEFEGICENLVEGIGTGWFDVVAHPDRSFQRCRVFGEAQSVAARRIVDAYCRVREQGICLEKNYTSWECDDYYRQEFWDMVPGDARIVYGIDAHCISMMKYGWREWVLERPV